MDALRHILLVAGPTAVGKTDAAIEAARIVDGEIVSADSRQVCRGMDIGTAKPSRIQKASVRHHLIDCVDPGEPFSAGAYRDIAERHISEIRERGREPIVVGGSTLYIESLVRGLSEVPDIRPEVRALVRERMQREGPESLYRDLQRVDPAAGASMDVTKTHRVLRALEVFYSTGKPISSYHETIRPPLHSYRMVVLTMDREQLDQRILTRTRSMLDAGLIEEVRGLVEQGVSVRANVLRTIGYREVLDMLEGRLDHSRLIETIAANTRRYARRQLTWFRRYVDATWLDAAAGPKAIANMLTGTVD